MSSLRLWTPANRPSSSASASTLRGSFDSRGRGRRTRTIGDNGFTLIDLLTSLVFASILGLLTATWAQAVIADARRQQGTAEIEEAVAVTLDLIAAECRSAGFRGGAAEVDALAFAGRDRIELHSDFDGDGNVSDSHERIVYSYRPGNRQLARASGQGNAQLLVDEVPAGGFQLSYFDAQGSELTSGTSGLVAAQRRAVRRIDVRLVAEQRVTGGATLRAEAITSIALRNRSAPS